MNRENVRKIEDKVKLRIHKKIASLSVFDDPRPRYVSKITIFDRIFEKTLLLFFPKYVRPNYLTVFRFISVPFVISLLLIESYTFALILFSISAISDALDGAMARTRKQITDWGIVFDPLADKLLIGSTGIIVISKLISPYIAGIIVFIELVLIISAYSRFKGKIVPAKLAGKIKMILQSFGVGFLLIFLVIGHPILITMSLYMLAASIVLALVSLLVYRSI